jgi:glycosyltransferase involved in cell wall biosynthesis
VIASDLPALRELIRDGENGLLVPPGEPAAWVAAIERLRQDPAFALRLAAAGRATAAAFGWDARARGIASALDLGTG